MSKEQCIHDLTMLYLNSNSSVKNSDVSVLVENYVKVSKDISNELSKYESDDWIF